jgi:hypothetical protein
MRRRAALRASCQPWARSRSSAARASSHVLRSFSFSGRRRGPGALERLEHAAAHLRGGLARERDGEDLLGPLDHREQAQEALDEQARLSRTPRAPGR